jgi:hypothetical protein
MQKTAAPEGSVKSLRNLVFSSTIVKSRGMTTYFSKAHSHRLQQNFLKAESGELVIIVKPHKVKIR